MKEIKYNETERKRERSVLQIDYVDKVRQPEKRVIQPKRTVQAQSTLQPQRTVHSKRTVQSQRTAQIKRTASSKRTRQTKGTENSADRKLLQKKRRQEILQKRYRRIYKAAAILLLAALSLSAVLNLITKDRSFSENENRILAQKPEFSMDSLIDGKFMSETEDYVADQFFLRDSWIRIKYAADRILGKRESNGVYLGKDGYLMEIPGEPEAETVKRTTDAIRDFADRHGELNTMMMLVPNAVTVCDQYLAGHTPVRDQREDIRSVENAVGENVAFCDITDTLTQHKTEKLYYKTDHHWTSLGAWYAFETLWPALGLESEKLAYQSMPVTNRFSGTLASKVGYHREDDVIDIYVPQQWDESYMVDYVGEKKCGTIYDQSALERKDKYEVFFGGNHARIDIQTLMPDRNLLILKDSYANAFVQFLLPYYSSITIIDPRYYYDSVEQLLTVRQITDVLFLYNTNTFLADTSLADALEA